MHQRPHALRVHVGVLAERVNAVGDDEAEEPEHGEGDDEGDAGREPVRYAATGNPADATGPYVQQLDEWLE